VEVIDCVGVGFCSCLPSLYRGEQLAFMRQSSCRFVKRTKGSPAIKIKPLLSTAGREVALPGDQLVEKRGAVGSFPTKTTFSSKRLSG